jgi:hypothetical protein
MITPSALIANVYASSSANTEYTVPALSTVIIDKFTVTNTDSSSRTVSINLVPSGGSVANTNLVIQTLSINAGQCYDFTELRNQILATGDFISVTGSVASKLALRASGRVVT